MVDVIASGGASEIKMEDGGSSEKSIIIGPMVEPRDRRTFEEVARAQSLQISLVKSACHRKFSKSENFAMTGKLMIVMFVRVAWRIHRGSLWGDLFC